MFIVSIDCIELLGVASRAMISDHCFRIENNNKTLVSDAFLKKKKKYEEWTDMNRGQRGGSRKKKKKKRKIDIA